MIHFQMRFAWDRNCSLYNQSCNRLILGLVGSVGGTLSCGHGWGQGSQRWVAARRWPPAECDAGEGAQVEGHKKGLQVAGPVAARGQHQEADDVLLENAGSSCCVGCRKCARTALDP